MRKILILAVLGILMSNLPAYGEIMTETTQYELDGVTLEGLYAYDDSWTGPHPGVLICHAWMGLGDHERETAEKLAAEGCAAFALDIFGVDTNITSFEEASANAGIYREDLDLLRARAYAGLEVLRNRPEVAPDKIVAIGFCFGGGTVLELARSGADINGIVTFHGSLTTPDPTRMSNFQGKALICHGADDPHANLDTVMQVNEELKNGGVDYEIILYGGAVHSFTDPYAGNNVSSGAAYNEDAARRSWDAMMQFLHEVFSE